MMMRIIHRRRSSGRLTVVLIVLALLSAGCGLAEQADDDEGDGGDAAEESGAEEGAGDAISVAILSDCEGAFGDFYEQTIGGALAAFANHGGGEPEDRSQPSAGMTGIEVAGTPIEIADFGCSDDTADTAIEETRRLMEQLDADILIGPLSGDEAIAVANYALANPEKTFINGAAGSLDPTMKVQAPNFFRYQGDGAQWNAGLGDVAFNQLGWETAAVIADDYSFAWTSSAGFIADFCAVGGDVTSRVFPPLNETDYSSHVRQLPAPDQVDGYFWAVGGAGLLPALKAFEDAFGPLEAEQHIGNLFWGTPGQYEELSERVAGAYVGSAGSAGDLQTPEAVAYTENIAAVFDEFPPFEGDAASQAPSTFVYNYYNAALGLIRGLEATGGQLGDGQADLQEALADVVLEDAGYGSISLDSNRNGIQTQFVQQLYMDGDELAVRTVAMVPDVDQSFGGTFTPDGEVPSRDYPPCEERDLPWSGNLVTITDGVPQD